MKTLLATFFFFLASALPAQFYQFPAIGGCVAGSCYSGPYPWIPPGAEVWASGSATPGGQFTFWFHKKSQFATTTWAMLGYGGYPSGYSTPFGTLYVDPTSAQFVATQNHDWITTKIIYPIPNDSGLIGLNLAAQRVHYDAIYQTYVLGRGAWGVTIQ